MSTAILVVSAVIYIICIYLVIDIYKHSMCVIDKIEEDSLSSAQTYRTAIRHIISIQQKLSNMELKADGDLDEPGETISPSDD